MRSEFVNRLRKTRAELIMHCIGRPDDFLRQFPFNKFYESI